MIEAIGHDIWKTLTKWGFTTILQGNIHYIVKLKFVELPKFTDAITKIDDDEAYNELQRDLMQNPEKGAVIKHSGGVSR